MVVKEATGEKIQDKLLRELWLERGVLRIFEREEEQYIFDWKRKEDGREPPTPWLVKVMIGKFLCNLDNQTEELARRIFETREELEKAELEERRKIIKRLEDLERHLLPHLFFAGEMEKIKNRGDALVPIGTYWMDKTERIPISIFKTEKERTQFESLGEF